MSEIVNQEDSRTDILKTILLYTCILLAAVLYYPVIRSLAGQWMDDPNYRHGILIPLVSGFLVWRRREELSGLSDGRLHIAGLLLILASGVLLAGGTAAAELFTARISLPLLIFGAALYLRGADFTGKAAFPILFLLMMVPLPYIIYYKLTFPMQLMSARFSAGILKVISVNVIRKGNILLLPGYTLEVVAACSGLRSLMTMVTLAMIMSAFSAMSKTKKVLLVLMAVPVAIAANTIRLVVTALGAYTVGPEFADGPLHQASGLIVFLSGIILLMICAGILRWIK